MIKIFSNSRGVNTSIMRSLKAYFALTAPFIIIFVSLRVYDFVNIVEHSKSLMSYSELFYASLYDFMLALSISGIALIIFVLLSFLSSTIARTIFVLLFSMILILYIAFIQYFSQALVPLDQVVFIYDFSDIVNIAFSSGFSSFTDVFIFIIAISSYVLSVFVISKVKRSSYLIAFISLIMIGAGVSTNLYIVSSKDFKSELHYFCNTNKFIYFVKAVSKYSANEDVLALKEIDSYVVNYRKLDNSSKDYGPRVFPFQYKNDNKCTISKYFKSLGKNEKPNIVFIVVESLSPTVSGKYSPNHSFTPFIDSLAEHSLYWRNCLSTSERTFGVLPSLFASLPPEKEGFMQQKNTYPKFLALPKMLKSNGYATQMFYGGWAGFTNMDKFVIAAGIDSIYNNFAHYQIMPRSANGHTWGYGDNVLFKASDKYIVSDTSYFSLYLTLSTHSPFASSEPNYLKAYTDSIIETIDNEEFKIKCRKFSDGVKSFMVLDNELRLFFKRYKNRPEFYKTIFVITGDHKGLLFNAKNSIDKYTVPLIIYSPLLVSSQEFGGVITHNDVFPTIQNLLMNNYGVKNYKANISLGRQLDTSIVFNAKNCLFPMRNSREMIDFLYGKYYLNNGRLYQVSDTMNLTAIKNDSILNSMQKTLDEFIKLQNYSIENNSLLSPSEYYLE